MSIRRVAEQMGISQGAIFRWCSDILRPKKVALKGHQKSKEHRANLSKSRTDMTFTEEHRSHLSDAQKRMGTIPPSQKGAIPWNYRGVTSLNERIRKSPAYQLWRANTFTRDDFTCQVCLTRGGKLRAHHIKKFSIYPSLRLDPNNGVTICESCDREKVWNHEKEWEEFFHQNLNTRFNISQ